MVKPKSSSKDGDDGRSPSELINERIERQGRLVGGPLDGNTRRAIDICEADKIDEQAFKVLVRVAVELNES